MESLALVGTGQFWTDPGAARPEVILVVACAVLGVLVLVLRSNLASATRRRRSSGASRSDRRTARHAPGRRHEAPARRNGPAGVGPARRTRGGQAMAPTFTSPRSGRRHRRGPHRADHTA